MVEFDLHGHFFTELNCGPMRSVTPTLSFRMTRATPDATDEFHRSDTASGSPRAVAARMTRKKLDLNEL